MAPLPKRRHSTRRGGKRKAAIHLTKVGFIKCANCSALRIPHQICKACGFYDGKAMVVKKIQKAKKT